MSGASSLPLVFPHEASSAAKTAKAGVLTHGDTIGEDAYHVMTRKTKTDLAYHTSAAYSYNEDTSTLVESARSIYGVNAAGEAAMGLLLLHTQSDGISQSMQPVIAATPVGTSFTAVDPTGGPSSTASFTNAGLTWDQSNASIYLGGDLFRIQFVQDASESEGLPTLRIQAKRSDGTYTTKWSISND